MPEEESKQEQDKETKTESSSLDEKAPIITQHELELGDSEDETLHYTATTGMMPMRNKETGEIEAEMFFVAYTLDPSEYTRPLVFVFNGGPGSASVWLHLGAIGPKRVKMQDEGFLPAPPYQLVTNPHTWLDVADLVFIDPVGTGYSRAAKPDYNQKYWSVQGDLDAVGEFIRLYLTRYKRWKSPLFLAGESYGTTRAAGLSSHLVQRGIALNGIVLISTILNFQTARFTRGNDLPYPLFLPTYTATAWYHGKLPDDLQTKPLRDVLDEVEAWAETDYTLALMKGDRLTTDERDVMIHQLARYTGLSQEYLDYCDLRINIMRFCKELLRTEKQSVGRLDSRFSRSDLMGYAEYPEFDPSMTDIIPPYTAMMNDYARNDLDFETDTSYEVLSYEVNREWEWERGQFPDTSDALRTAFRRNPYMKILVAQGYYDLATPYFAADYTLNHSGFIPDVRDNIKTAHYEAGHMLYLDVRELAKFKDDVAAFIADSVPPVVESE